MINKTVKLSFFIGLIGGFVGLGGGIILTPLWLEMGLPPKRAAATATVCVMLTSFVSMIQIAVIGGYKLDEFLALMVFKYIEIIS